MPAPAVAEVDELVDGPVGLLDQDVLAGDPDLRRAGLDVGGHVGGAHGHEPQLAEVEDQRPRIAAGRGGVEADRVEQVEGAVEQRSARRRQPQGAVVAGSDRSRQPLIPPRPPPPPGRRAAAPGTGRSPPPAAAARSAP